MPLDSFVAVAAQREPRLDELALALTAEFREVDADAALARLDRLGQEVAAAAAGGEQDEVEALREVLGRRHGFTGAREEYDHPDNSMLDLVLERRTGLPILLSVVYLEVARRARIELEGIGLPGHYVVGRLVHVPPVLLDPYAGGRFVTVPAAVELRPWGAHETVLRMLNNLVGSYQRRNDLARAIRAAELRLELPVDEEQRASLGVELRTLRARLN